MITFQKDFFKNGSVPGVILETDNPLPPHVKKRLTEEFRKAASVLFKNSRSPVIIDGGLKMKSLGSHDFEKLDFEASIERVKKDISQALGCPYDLINGNNNSNFAQLRKEFFQQTIIPISVQFADALSKYFQVSIKINRPALDELRSDLRSEQQFHTGLVNGGIETVNEARKALGLPSLTFDQMQGEFDPDQVIKPVNIAGSAVTMEEPDE